MLDGNWRAFYLLFQLSVTDQFVFNWKLPSWQMHNYQSALHLYPIVVIYVVLLFISLLSLSARMLKSSLRLKKQIQMLSLVFTVLFVLGVIDFYFSGSLCYFSLAIVPLTYFLTYAFLSKRSGIPANIFFYIALLYSFVKFFLNFTQD
jgi:hypothetical protein